MNPGSALLEPAVGEDLDDELENIADEDQDRQEPTDTQKRELLKIHRGVGHPQPNELGRALRNAGVKRHLIRWAIHDMRCPTISKFICAIQLVIQILPSSWTAMTWNAKCVHQIGLPRNAEY